MSQGTLDFNGGHAFEPTRVNRALAQLTRLASRERVSPLSRADLIGLGVFAGARSWSNACGAASASNFARPRRTTVGVLNSQ